MVSAKLVNIILQTKDPFFFSKDISGKNYCISIAEDFWLGLQKIYSIAQQGVYILRIDLEDWKEETHWAEYRLSLEGPSKDYTLHVTHYAGDLPDAMASSTGMRFSTKDRHENNHQSLNCSRNYAGSVSDEHSDVDPYEFTYVTT